ncbi:hypothetical protein [Streptomyces sp. NPDC016845]|uniref:hypothetical protein n=1 Tax=Streptomyces sp. NPDC016845 TaxID=3364972 RepID=UPI0037962D3B
MINRTAVSVTVVLGLVALCVALTAMGQATSVVVTLVSTIALSAQQIISAHQRGSQPSASERGVGGQEHDQ